MVPASGFEVRQFEQATFFREAGRAHGLAADRSAVGCTAAPRLAGQRADADACPALPQWAPLPWTPPAHANARYGRGHALGTSGTAPAPQGILPGGAGAGPHRRRQGAGQAASSLCRLAARHGRARAGAGDDRSCLREEPLLLEAQLWKASLAEEAGDLAGAEQSYRRALYIDRLCPIAHFHLALVLQRKGDPNSARRSLTTTLGLIQGKNPHSPVEHGEGICYGRLQEMATLLAEKPQAPG